MPRQLRMPALDVPYPGLKLTRAPRGPESAALEPGHAASIRSMAQALADQVDDPEVTADGVLQQCGFLSAVTYAEARQEATGSDAPREQTQHGPLPNLDKHQRDELSNFVLCEDQFLRQVEYGARCGDITGIALSQPSMSRYLHERRKADGKKPINRKKRQKTPSNASLARILDMMVSFSEAMNRPATGPNWGPRTALGGNEIWRQMGMQDECGLAYGRGNHPDYGYAEAGVPVASDYPHHATKVTILMANEFSGPGGPRIVKVCVQEGGCKGDDCYDFCCATQEAPAHAPNLGGGPLYEEFSETTKIMAFDLLGRSGKADDPDTGHFNPKIQGQGQGRGRGRGKERGGGRGRGKRKVALTSAEKERRKRKADEAVIEEDGPEQPEHEDLTLDPPPRRRAR